MKILLAGLSPTTVATIRLIASTMFRGASLHNVERGTSGAVPQQSAEALRCQLCVVDTHGLRWSQWYPEHAARVEILLAGRAAVLLLPPESSGGWFDAAQFSNAQNRFLLRRPVSDAGIADALRCAAAAATRSAAHADEIFLSNNIWMQARSTPPTPRLAELGPKHQRLAARPQKNVFRFAVSALFS